MKMLSRKIVCMCVALCSIGTMLGGCAEKKTAESDKITLTLWTKPTQDAKDYVVAMHDRTMEALRKEFPDINFEEKIPPQGGTDYRQEYDKALMAGTAPAFTDVFSYTDIPSRIENETIADITKYVADWDLKKEGKLIDTFDDAISKDGKWYAIPYKAYTQATLVGKKPVEAASGDMNNLPSTWKEFAEFGEKATDLSIPRLGYAMLGMDWCAWPYTAWVWSAGGDMVEKNSDGTYRIAFNDEAGVDAAEFLNQMIWKYKMTQKDVLLGLEDLRKLSLNGTACFAWMNFAELKKETIEDNGLSRTDFSVMPMPVKDSSIPRPALSGGEVVTFNPKLTEAELEAAIKVAKWYYFSDESMQRNCDAIKEFGLNDTYIPGRVDWYERKLQANEWLTDEQKQALQSMGENAKAEPYCGHWSDLKTELIAPLQKIYLTEGISRDEIKKLLDECADKLYTLYPETFKRQ